MKLHTFNILLLAATATSITIPQQEVQKVLAAIPSTSQHDQQPTSTSPDPIIPWASPPPPFEEESEGTTTIFQTVTRTTTIAMTTALVIHTETATPSPGPRQHSHWGWSWSWLWGGNRAGGCDDTSPVKAAVVGGMGCFCSGGSVCCYDSGMRLGCNYGSCGVI